MRMTISFKNDEVKETVKTALEIGGFRVENYFGGQITVEDIKTMNFYNDHITISNSEEVYYEICLANVELFKLV